MTNLIQRVGSASWGELVALLVVALSVHAMAQFEVAPDHFDSNTSVEKKHAFKQATATLQRKVAASPTDAANVKAQGFGQGAVVARNGVLGTTIVVAGSESGAAFTKSTTKKEAARRKKRAEKLALASRH